MKQAAITKSLEEPTSAELEQISRFARRPLKPEEVYLFSLVLCDNDVDRDLECFPRASLEKLAELFVGKTGIFDHNPKGENQTARIYKTQVLETPGRTERRNRAHLSEAADTAEMRNRSFFGFRTAAFEGGNTHGLHLCSRRRHRAGRVHGGGYPLRDPQK